MSSKPKTTSASKRSDATTEAQADELADQIAAVLNNPLTPNKIYNALSDAVTELYVPEGYTDQPEYLRGLLRNYFGLEWKKGGAS
jgi:hypothetical protein